MSWSRTLLCSVMLLAVLVAARTRSSTRELNAKTDVFRKDRCTSIAVGHKAMVERSSITTHTNDCYDCDFRVGLIKGKLHKPGSKRPVPPARFQYPRYVGFDSDPAFTPDRITDRQYPWQVTIPNGYIDEVEKTYSFLDGAYALINEHQVGFGESTCSARLVNVPIHDGGKAMFDISDLSRVAASRARSAREAIRIMGDLAVKYGYYGAEWKGADMYGESGEALSVADPHETWMFHILPDGEGASAVWAAQRVPDDHLAVCANEFIIGEMDLNNKDYFMASDNVQEVAIKNKFWDPNSGTPFNFRKAYSEPAFHVHREYADRRNWRVLSMAAPSRGFPDNSTLNDLPFSVKPDRLLTLEDIFAMNRDHYEGTRFDLTKGLAAGPFGNPNRYDPGWASGVPIPLLMEGNFERAISIHRTNYAVVTQSRAHLPNVLGGLVWMAQAQPQASCFMPLYPGVNRLAPSLQEGSLWKFRRDSSWWAFDSVNNLVEKSYVHMIADVRERQRYWETNTFEKQATMERELTQLLSEGHSDAVREKLTQFNENTVNDIVGAWWDLLEWLFTRFNNGARIDDWHTAKIEPVALFYPFEWLKHVSFWPVDMDFNHPLPKAPAGPRRSPPPAAGAAEDKKDKKKDAAPAAEFMSTDAVAGAPSLGAAVNASQAPSASALSSGLSWLGYGALIVAVYAAGVATGRVWQKKAEYESVPLVSSSPYGTELEGDL